MMTWDALVHKQSNKEIKYIIVAVIVVLLGFLNEIWIRCGQAVFEKPWTLGPGPRNKG